MRQSYKDWCKEMDSEDADFKKLDWKEKDWMYQRRVIDWQEEEIKELKAQLAHANCSWQQEKSMRYSAVAREQKLKMLIEDLINSDVDEIWKASAAKYLQKVYGDAA